MTRLRASQGTRKRLPGSYPAAYTRKPGAGLGSLLDPWVGELSFGRLGFYHLTTTVCSAVMVMLSMITPLRGAGMGMLYG